MQRAEDEERCALTSDAASDDAPGEDSERPAPVLVESRPSALSRCSQLARRLNQFWFVRETVEISKLAIPMISSMFFQQLIFIVSLVFVGHISSDTLQLDSAALAISMINVLGVSVGHGFSSAAETLCTQAYGFNNLRRVGVITQRGILILCLVMFPVLIMWLNTETLLLLLQQDACVARLSGVYVKVFSISLPSIFLLSIIQRYLQAQSIVFPFVLAGLAANIISAALHGILLYWFHMGLIGSAISMSVSVTFSTLLLLLYIRVRNLHRDTWGGWSWDSLREWGQFSWLGVPGLLMVCCEWWCYEISAFVTGSVSKTQLGIHTILIQVLSTNFMIPLGIGMAVTVRVGNELGAGSPLRAKRATHTAFVLTAIYTLVVCIVLFSVRDVVGKLFSNNQEVIEGVATVSYVAIPLMFFDSFQGMIQGVIRGTGKQLLGAIINFTAFYLLGFPLGVVLAITMEMGTLGMWLGLLLAVIVQTMLYFGLVLKTNWEKQSQKAIKRSQEYHDPTQSANQGIVNNGSSEKLITTEGKGLREEEETEKEEEEKWEEEEVHKVFREAIGSAVVTTEQNEMNDLDVGIEAIPLISLNNSESDLAPISPSFLASSSHKTRLNIKLLLLRGSFFVVGTAFLVLGGVASRYHPPRPSHEYCECSRELECGNETGNSTEWVWGSGNRTQDMSTSLFQTPSFSRFAQGSSFYLLPTPSP